MIQSKERFLYSGSLNYGWTSEMREDCTVQWQSREMVRCRDTMALQRESQACQPVQSRKIPRDTQNAETVPRRTRKLGKVYLFCNI